MPTQIGELGVTFPDATLQTTAAVPGAPGFGIPTIITFGSSAIWLVPAGVTRARVTVIGGGGGGGSGYYDGDSDFYGAGGGGGGTAIKIITGLVPGTSISITVGGGGGPGVNSGNSGGSGGTGGTSAFSNLLSATGGIGGNGFGSGLSPGGSGVNGTINITGNYGGGWVTAESRYFNNYGGASFMSPASARAFSSYAYGSAGIAYGGGGGGGGGVNGNTVYGGTGAAGVVIVEF